MKHFPCFLLVVALLTTVECLEEFETGAEGLDSFEDVDREPLHKKQPNLDYIEGDFPSHKPSTSSIGSGFVDTSDVFDHAFGAGLFNPFIPFGPVIGGSGFNFGNAFGGSYKPWHKGPNVCTTREETTEEEDKDTAATQGSFIQHFSLNVESCSETSNKHICKRITNQGGHKKTIIHTSQCCHGFKRSRSSGFCEKFELLSIAEIAEKLHANQFMNAAVKNDLNDMMNSTNITIFMPSDESFMQISNDLVDNELAVAPLRSRRQGGSEGSFKARDVVLNHIVEGFVDIENVDNEQIFTSEYENHTIRMNVYPKIYFRLGSDDVEDDDTANSQYLYTANCVPVRRANIFAKNGIVHKIDGVLTPISENVMDIIRARSDMTILKTVLEKTKMDQMLDGFKEDSPKQFTIFAPTDAAFEKLDPQLKRKLKEGSSCAENIMKNHILDLTFCSSAVMDPEARVSAYNMLGQKMIFEKTSNATAKDEEKMTNEIKANLDGTIIINDKAKILERDLVATNGVVHIIDILMETPSALPISTMLGKKNITIFKNLMEYGSFADDFDNLENATYFAPTDAAFETSDVGKYWMKQLEETPQKLKNNENLKRFLDYHVVQPMTKSSELTEGKLQTVEGEALRVNLYSTMPGFTNIMNLGTVNCARLVHFDQESCGSVLHQIDRVLTPPNATLMQILENNSHYSQFLKLVKKSNLTSMFDELEGKGYTLFVPRDEVFAEVDDWIKKKSDIEVEELIKNHIASDVTCCAGIIRAEWPFTYTIKTISGNSLSLNRDRRPRVQNAGVSKCDIIGTNGIIHEINDVINIQPRRPAQNNGGFYGSLFSKPFFFKK